MAKILELKDVSKIYGDLHALSHINLTVNEGEWLSIMGPSGSGKTTMLNIIGCMDTPSEGSVVLDGADISRETAANLTKIRRDKIGLIFQQFHLISYLSALENVMVAQYYHSMPDEKEAMEALEKVGLGQRAHHLPTQLSGGEQQRVSIARALSKKPKLLLCDEPTGALDYNTGKMILKLLQDTCRIDGMTVILVTHNSAIAPMADRIIRIKNSKVAEIITNDHPTPVEDIEW